MSGGGETAERPTTFSAYVAHCRECWKCGKGKICLRERELWSAVCAGPNEPTPGDEVRD